MARFEKLQDLFDLLWRTREPLPLHALCAELAVSPATAKRLIAVLRDNRGLDVRYQRDGNGYVLARGPLDNSVAMLLGLSSAELESLIEAEALLGKLHPGLLRAPNHDERSRLARVRRRYLASNGLVDRWQWRMPHGHGIDSAVLVTVFESLRRRCRLSIESVGERGASAQTAEVSPVRVIWSPRSGHLAGWSHEHESLQVFDLSKICEAHLLPVSCVSLDTDIVNALLDTGYGSQPLQADKLAVLRFTKEIATAIVSIHWHDRAVLRQLGNGSVELHVPYAHDQELIAEILRYGADCQVLEPPALRQRVRAVLQQALSNYSVRK